VPLLQLEKWVICTDKGMTALACCITQINVDELNFSNHRKKISIWFVIAVLRWRGKSENERSKSKSELFIFTQQSTVVFRCFFRLLRLLSSQTRGTDLSTVSQWRFVETLDRAQQSPSSCSGRGWWRGGLSSVWAVFVLKYGRRWRRQQWWRGWDTGN